ncbi:hypothetical protein LZ198_10095 [Myxococcus sp. K15C18031901]|uniref:hypothetical protein n=1 Tax=Myxococcus dinghuensis TaxID=2906761 RepID=UPI0020A81B4B|nr:hypothetical protein [Myxococcus dinghuensis]MCP3099220.1 hypothetical protein [Myxococcus dinghuensis]
MRIHVLTAAAGLLLTGCWNLPWRSENGPPVSRMQSFPKWRDPNPSGETVYGPDATPDSSKPDKATEPARETPQAANDDTR